MSSTLMTWQDEFQSWYPFPSQSQYLLLYVGLHLTQFSFDTPCSAEIARPDKDDIAREICNPAFIQGKSYYSIYLFIYSPYSSFDSLQLGSPPLVI